MLARKCAELEKLKGSGGELQIALKLLEEAQQEAAKLDEPARSPSREEEGRGRAARSRSDGTVVACRACRCAASWARRSASARRAMGR